jgi:phage terminase large subunit-like protein
MNNVQIELNKEQRIQLKIETAAKLKEIDVMAYELSQIDNRLNDYTLGVINNPNDHNLYELLAVKRFFYLLGKYLYNVSAVKSFIIFYESLKFSGLKGRQKYKLTPVQVFQFANILGFYVNENKRLIREALLFVPRKFSKTTSVASLAVYDLLFGDSNAQAYTAANSSEQAQICFDEIKNILSSMDHRLSHFKLNRKKITRKGKGKNSFIRCLSSDANKLDGLNASLVIVDEYSQAPSAELKNVLTSSMGGRVNPLTVVITTASDKLNSPFTDMLTAYKNILSGVSENDRIFASIFEPDDLDAEDDPHTWNKVQPHLGITVQPDYYELEYQKALMTADNMLTFRTKLLNIFVQNSDKIWITSEEVAEHYKKILLENLTKIYTAMVAVDLSVCDDFSAVSYNLYNEDSRNFHIHTDYYFPEGALAGHPNKEMYIKWAKEGYLKLLKGNVIDYDQIAKDIMRNGRYMKILQIGYDPYKSPEFINMISALGAKKYLIPIKQTYGEFTGCVEAFEIAFKTDKVTFNYNPINAYCFGNAVMDEDRLENRKPIKRSPNHKIDGAITALMTFKEFINYER